MNKIKRIAAVLLATIMMFSGITVFAAEENDENILINGGFEDLSEDGFASNWVTKRPEAITVNEQFHRTGKRSLYIEGAPAHPWASQAIAVNENLTYMLTGYINTDPMGGEDRGNGAGVKVEYYAADGSFIMNGKEKFMTDHTNGLWVYFDYTFDVPAGCTKVLVYCRFWSSAGYAMFDDLEVKLTAGPKKYSSGVNEVFYYPDDKNGTATLTIDEYYVRKGMTEGISVDYELSDNGKVILSSYDNSLKDGKAAFTYDMSFLTEKKKAYVITATVKENEETVETFRQNIYKVDRPTMLNENRDILVDGKVFNSVSVWHFYRNEYEKLAECGVNTVVGGSVTFMMSRIEELEDMLKEYEKNNLKCIATICVGEKNAAHPDNIENTRQIVEHFKDDDRIIAWMVESEPFGRVVTEEKRLELEQAYLLVHEIDSYHPIYGVEFYNAVETMKYSDVHALDIYVTMGNTTSITMASEKLYEAARGRKATYEIAATYSNNGKRPTANIIRNSIYRAFEGGVRGIGYFSFSDADGVENSVDDWIPLYEWDIWNDFCIFNKEEVPILFDLFVNNACTSFNYYESDKTSTNMLWYTWLQGDDMYLLAHNRGLVERSIDITLKSANGYVNVGGYTAYPIGLTKSGDISGDGQISLALASEEIALYKIVTNKKLDLTRLNESRFSDLAGYEWASEQIAMLDNMNIINSIDIGKYGPGQNITRADLAMFLIRTLGLQATGTENFADVDSGDYYAKEIAIGKELEILNGIEGNKFAPKSEISREDVMVICARGLALADKLSAPDLSILNNFSDSMDLSDYARDAMASMISSGIITGSGDRINPNGKTTRAEAAVIMQRILDTEVVEVEEKDKQPDVEEIEFADTPTEDQVSIWNKSLALLDGIGLTKQLNVKKSITCGEFEKILSSCLGYGYDVFKDDYKAITYNQIVESLISVLGYDLYLQRDGGYSLLASKIGLLKGTENEGDNPVRAGVMAKLLENAFGIELISHNVYGLGSSKTYDVIENATLLTEYMNIYKYEGKITGNYYTSYKDSPRLKKGQVSIDGELYEIGETNADKFLGRKVTVYYVDETYDKTIKYVEPYKKVNVVVAEAEDILDKTTKSCIYIEDENYKETTINLNSDAVLIYNGVEKTPWDESDLFSKYGTVTFIENDGISADMIIIEAFDNFIIDSINKDESIVFCDDGTEIILDERERNTRIQILKSDGKETTLDYLTKGRVLSIAKSEDGKNIKAIVTNRTIKDKPSEISDDEVMISGTMYKKAPHCTGETEPSVTAMFYFDFKDRIAAIRTSGIAKNYGYFTYLSEKKGIDPIVFIKIFTATGEMKVFEAADKFKINGYPINKREILGRSEFLNNGKPKGQLVVYETNDNGLITEIYTAVDASTITREEELSTFTWKRKLTGQAAVYRGHGLNSFMMLYRVTGSTVLFKVPSEYSTDDRDYTVIKYTSMNSGDTWKDAYIYDVDKDYKIGAVVQTFSSGQTSGTAVDVYHSETGLIKKFRTVLDKNENHATVIDVITRLGEKSIFVPDDLRIVMNNKTITNKSKDPLVSIIDGVLTIKPNISVTELNVGDIVAYEAGGANGDQAVAMTVLLRGQYPVSQEESQDYTLTEELSYDGGYRCFGTVEEKIDNGFIVTPGKYKRGFLFVTSAGYKIPVAIYDSATKTVTNGSVDSITVGSRVFVRRANPYMYMTVVYK